jgi:hypothetical protein
LALMILLSFTGTLRAILVLLIIWLVLRMIMRGRSGQPGPARRSFKWGRPDDRKPGDVRIEKPGKADPARRDQGPVEDADFEEIR